MVESKTEEIAHRWQSFRITCLELALKGGATEQNMIDVADKLGKYIVTKSELEKSVAAAGAVTNGDRT